jgi:hypothetical protein
MLEPSDRREWFVSDGNGLEGPFTFERIRDLIRWGRISTRAYLCDEYHSAWIPIRQSALASALAEELGTEETEGAREPARGTAAELPHALSRLALVAAALGLLAVIGMLAD